VKASRQLSARYEIAKRADAATVRRAVI
jgi:hypothetical protein